MTYATLWPLLGTFLLGVAIYDFYTTTMTLKGGGPLSRHLSYWLWFVFLRIQRLGNGRRLLPSAGPVILLLMIIIWFSLCWAGWVMIFSANEFAVVDAKTLEPATFLERVYYAGYTLTTIGYGDFKASSEAYQIASIISGFNGLFLVTLAITYSIPILSASAERRQLSLLIHSLGESTEEIIRTGYSDGSFHFLNQQLQQLNEKIASVSQNHLAYPVLHYFHDPYQAHALPLNLTRLQEAITIIRFAFPDIRPECAAQLNMTRKVIENFLANMEIIFTRDKVSIPGPPPLTTIENIPGCDKTANEIAQFMKNHSQRERLHKYIISDGWSWKDVHLPANNGR